MDNFFQKTIRISFCLLFILVPLILTPWNYELFEFNKMLAVYALTSIIVGAWVGRMIRLRRVIFIKTFFDIPLILFFLSQVLSFLFSIDRHTSFWGYYSRFHGGLFSTVCYLLLYWAFVSNFSRSHLRGVPQAQHHLGGVFGCMLFTATLVSLYGIAEHFGIDAHLWVQDVRNRVFSTLGQPNWLSAYLAILIPVVIGFSITEKSKFKFTVYYLLFTIYYLCFLYTKSQSGLLGLGISLFFFWLILFFVNLKTKFIGLKDFFSHFLILNSLFLILFSKVGFAGFPEIAGKLEKFRLIKKPAPKVEISSQIPAYQPPALEVGGTASSEIRKIVWKGAVEIFKHYPIFGSGVETFAYSYYNFRPIEHNMVSEWDFLYNKAHNEYLNFLATTGLVGLGTYLLFIGSFIFWGIKNLKPDLTVGLFTGWFSILITNFFGFSVVPVTLFLFLIPAFCIVLAEQVVSHQPPVVSIKNFSTTQKFLLIILLTAESWLLLTVVKLWRADYHYAQGQKLNKIGQYTVAFQELAKAVDLNKGEPVYRNEIAESAANLALYAFGQKDATSASKLAQVALSQSEQALGISPRNLNFWKGRIKVLYNLTQINKDFTPAVIEAIQQSIKLAPTDPKLRYNLGIIYGSFEQEGPAIQSFKEAIDLKPNYKDARFALATYLAEKGLKEEAKIQLEYILQNLDPSHSPSAKLLEELK